MLNFSFWLETESTSTFPNSTIKQKVYHGTNQKFNNFEVKKSKRYILFSEFDVETNGFFFSESPYDALEYGSNVVECYINLTNPLLDPRRDKHLSIEALDRKKEIDIQKILSPLIEKDNKYGFFIDLGVKRIYLNSSKNQRPIDWIYNAIHNEGLDWDCLDNPNVIKKMKSLGYDGTFVAEPNSYFGRSIFICDKSQIQIIGWYKGTQEKWGNKEDYYTRKIDGYSKLFSPIHKESINYHQMVYSWVDPKGEIIPIPTNSTHAGWAAKQKLSIRDLFEKGWQRVIYYGDTVYINNSSGIRPNNTQFGNIKDAVIQSNVFKAIYFDNDSKDYLLWAKEEEY